MRFFDDRDPTLPLKIARMRLDYCRVNLLMWGASVDPSPVMKDLCLDKDAPEIIALFDEYGRDTMVAAVRNINEIVDALGEDLRMEDEPLTERGHDGLEGEA